MKTTLEPEIILSKRDRKLAEIMPSLPKFPSGRDSAHYFDSLVRTIISQQLSNGAADSIIRKFAKFSPRPFQPELILKLDAEIFKGSGISKSKSTYINNLATLVVSGKINLKKLENLSDDIAINELTKIRGIGQWTAQIFLIFSLGRANVWPVGDAGLRRAIAKIYNTTLTTEAEFEEFANKWSPYRSVAAWYLWQFIDK